MGASRAAWPAASTTSRADLAVQQPVHRMVSRQIGRDRLTGLLLPGCQLEGQLAVERREQTAVGRRARLRHVLGGPPPPLGEHHLQHEGLVPLQPPDRTVLVLLVFWPVNSVERPGVAVQPVAIPDLGWQRISG